MQITHSLALALAALAFPSAAAAQWSQEALDAPKTHAGIATVGPYLLVAGGTSHTGAMDTVDIYNAQTRTWSASNSLSISRGLLAGMAWEQRAYFSGGKYDLNTVTDRIDVFEAVGGTWSQLTMPTSRFFHSTAAANGILMFACGSDEVGILNSVDLYEVSSGTWSSTTIADARNKSVCVAVGDELLIVGGSDNTGWLSSVAIYDTATQIWRTDTIPGVPRIESGAVVGDRAYFVSHDALGGADIFVYDGPSQSWSTLSLSVERSDVSVLAFGTLVLFAGGDVFPHSQSIVDVYDTLTGLWTVEQLPYTTHRAMSASIYGRAVFPGGLHNALVSSQVNVYEPNVGSSACAPAVVNSTGASATIRAVGRARAGGEPLALVAENMPPGQFALILAGRTLEQSPIAGSNGILCLGAPFGRFTSSLSVTSSAGLTSIPVDTTALPLLGGTAALAGQTWFFQAWFREPAGSSNLSDAVGVTFH